MAVFWLCACGDSSGGGGGGASTVFVTGLGFNFRVEAVTAATDGSGDLYVGGAFTDFDGTSVGRIARLNSDGSLDPDFDSGIGFNGLLAEIVAADDGSGDVFVGGLFSDYNGDFANGIIRLNSDGTIDTGFNSGSGFNGPVIAIALATDGSGDIYVGGDFTIYRGNSRVGIARVNRDGSNDAGFDTGSGFIGILGADPVVLALAVTDDGTGDVYAAGAFSGYRGSTRNRIARINSTGVGDAGFLGGSGFNDNPNALALATDGSGDIYVGGRFTLYRLNSSPGIARVDSDSLFVIGFDVGNAVETLDLAVATDGSGDLYAAGTFRTYRGNISDGLIRLNSDGTFDPGFATGSGFGGATVRSLALRPGSTDVYWGGDFMFYDGEDIGDGTIRLGADGRRN